MRALTKLAVLPLAALVLSTPVLGIDVSPDNLAALRASLPQEAVSKNGVYIVQMSEQPVAVYDGGIKGYKATRPKKNQKLNPNNGAVSSYADYLVSRHDALLQQVGGGKKVHSYKFSFNGFAAQLNNNQIKALRKAPGVLSVSADELRQPNTVTTSAFLGLDSGIWNDLGGVGNAGEGVIVGIIDSGVWPESESFSDRTGSNKNGKEGKLSFQQIPGWHGKCTPGEAFPASDCNQKLIGVPVQRPVTPVCRWS
jgi:hypothetical protein